MSSLTYASLKRKLQNNPSNNPSSNKKCKIYTDFLKSENWRSVVDEKIADKLEIFFMPGLNDFKIHVDKNIIYCSKKELYMSGSPFLKAIFDDKDFNGELILDPEICPSVTSLVLILYLLSNKVDSKRIDEDLVLKTVDFPAFTLQYALLLSHHWNCKEVENIILTLIKESRPSVYNFKFLAQTKNEDMIHILTRKYIAYYRNQTLIQKTYIMDSIFAQPELGKILVRDLLDTITG
jgi:hypothetical protein